MSGFGEEAGLGAGLVQIFTTSGGGHPPEFFAERIMAKIMYVSDTAPEPIKAQALAYRDTVHAVILEGIKRAIASDRAYRK
jgi:hypothetical protein